MPAAAATHIDLPIVLRKLQVLRVMDVTPRMRRITVTGSQLGAFRSQGHEVSEFRTEGADDYVKLFLGEDGAAPVLPEQHDGHLHWPKRPAPVARSYTVRRYDAVARELDLDFVLHGHGPAGEWAASAAPGDELNLAGPKASTIPPTAAAWWLLVGDETALPAIGRFAEEHGNSPVHAVALVDGPAEEQRELPGVTWAHRRDGVADGELLREAVQTLAATLPHGFADGAGWMWIAGEAGTVRALRGLARELHVPRGQLDASGYWRDKDGESTIARLRDLRAQAASALDQRRRQRA